MASVKFNLKDVRKVSGSTPIIARVSFSGKSFKYYIGESIPVKYWNFENQHVRQTMAFVDYIHINHLIDKIPPVVSKIHLEFKTEGVNPSVTQFKTRLAARLSDDSESESLLTFFDKFIESKRSQRAENTIKKYITCKNQIIKYSKAKGKTLFFNDINLSFYNDFLAYLYNTLKHSQNTAGKAITIIKAVMNEAVQLGLTKNQFFKTKSFKAPSAKTTKVYLTETEIQTIYNYDFSDNAKLDRVRDILIIGCYTGLRFSDVTRIKKENILARHYKGKDVQIISITAKKTDKQTIVPLKPIVQKIFRKYTIKDNLMIPRAISNQKMNDYIKDVVKAAGIKQTVEIIVNESGQSVAKIFEKWQLVSSHTCRRSFATNALLSGMEKQRIMNITGHVKEKDFDSYVCLTKEELSILSSDDPFFM